MTIGAAMLWYGRDPQKAVLPGIVAGLVPLVFALCANHMHACGADGFGRFEAVLTGRRKGSRGML